MENNTTNEFEGFEFTTPAVNIIAGDSTKLQVLDDGSGSTGDISKVDKYFNNDMIKADKEINDILKSI